jgi:hypothetical protein
MTLASGEIAIAASCGKDQAPAVTRMRLLGANAKVQGELLDPKASTTNYFLGSEPKKWRTDVATFGKVRFREVYPGIDVVYYGNENQLEYDFEVHPGADLAKIRLGFDGAAPRIDESGDLVVTEGPAAMKFRQPVAYQEIEGVRKPVAVRYRMEERSTVRLEAAAYDGSRKLVVDPVLVFTAVLGGSSGEYLVVRSKSIARDTTGNLYVTGSTGSPNFPVVGAVQPVKNGGSEDIFITKLSPDGATLIYATFLGGSNSEESKAIQVDAAGNVYVAGFTTSTDFPTANAVQPSSGGSGDGFLAKLNPSGSALVYSTYWGGNSRDSIEGLAVESSSGIAAVGGNTDSPNFPTTPGAFQPPNTVGGTAFVAKYSPTGAVQFASLFSGSASAHLDSVAIDSSGSVYATGYTSSETFPVTPGAYRVTMSNTDTFVTKFLPNGSGLAFSTFLGGSSVDVAYSMTIDSAGNPIVTGYTYSPDFPTTPGAYDSTPPTSSNKVFVSKISSSGSSLLASTLYGGNSYSYPSDVSTDSSGNPAVVGYTYDPAIPLVNPLQPLKLGVAAPLYRSADGGGSWIAQAQGSTGLPSGLAWVSSIATTPSNPNRFLLAQYCTVYRSEDRGEMWTFVGFIPGCNQEVKLVAHPANQNLWFAYSIQGVFQSADAGANWTAINSGLPSNPGIRSFAVSPSNPSVLYAGSWYAVYKSTNAGISWVQIASVSGGDDLFVSQADPQSIHAVGGVEFRKSTDGGATWTSISAPICCGRIAVHPSNSNSLFHAVDGLMQKSVDGGLTWTNSAIGAGSAAPDLIAFNPGNPQEMFLGFSGEGIYRSGDGGVAWTPVNRTMPFRQDYPSAIAISPGTNTVVLAGFRMSSDGFIAKFNSGLTALVYSTYWGVVGFEGHFSVASASTDLYVAGSADSSSIPIAGTAYSSPSRGSQDTYIARISDGNGGCVTSLSPSTLVAHQYGGNAQIRVLTGGGCSWNVTAAPPWVSVAPSNSGTGLGLVEINYTKNTTGAQRSGTITINGQNHTITQQAGPACTISDLTPPRLLSSGSFSSDYMLWVSASSGCQLSVTSDSAWAVITSGASLVSNGYIGLSVAANSTSSARTATITVTSLGGDAVATTKIHQSGTGCTNSLASSSGAIGASGGTVTVNFQTSPTGCSVWQAYSSSSWITPPATTTGTGNASVTFTVSANQWNTPRIGVMTVGDLQFTVTQSAGSACSASGSLTPFIALNGSLSSSDCLSQTQSNGTSPYYAKQYTFTATAGQRFAADAVSSSSGFYPYISLLGPDGTNLYSNSGGTAARTPHREFYPLPASGTYRVEVTSSWQAQSGNFTLRLLSSCTTFMPTRGTSLPAGGGTVSFPISVSESCTWTHTNHTPALLTVTSPLTRIGSGSVTLRISANTQSEDRSGYLVIGDSYYQVSQAGTRPSTPFSPSYARIPAAGVGSQNASAAPSSSWIQPLSTVPWIYAVTYNQSTGQVTYSVFSNLGPERTGRILLGNDALTIVQASTMPDKIGIYANGAWVMDLNGNGSFEGNPTDKYVEFGNSLYSPVLGDWMAQSKTSMAIFYNGLWYVDFNQNRQWDGSVLDLAAGLGGDGWTPVSGDWDGDGTINIGVFNPTSGWWYLDMNGDLAWDSTNDKAYNFGASPNSLPVVGDWNLDGKTEIGVYVNGYGYWYLDYNGDGAFSPAQDKQIGFGATGFQPVVGDWNGDGRSKIGIFLNCYWYLDYNGNFQWDGASTDRAANFGASGWTPVLGDWNGDGKKKIGIFNSGQWYLDYNGDYSFAGDDKFYTFGAAGQKPIVGKW